MQKRVYYCTIIVISTVFNIFSLMEKFKLWRLRIIPARLNSDLYIGFYFKCIKQIKYKIELRIIVSFILLIFLLCYLIFYKKV